MKVGILTVHDSANFGSFLQAYALNKVLLDMGHEVYFIKIVSKIRRFRDFIKKPKNLDEFKFNYKNYRKFSDEFKEFKEIDIEDIEKYNLDTLVIGSDELWNVKNPFFRQKCFYGIDIPIKNKIAYAISMGNVDSKEFKKYDYAVNAIKNLDEVFTRDENTQNTLEEVVGRKCKFACDPTFLIDINNFEKKKINLIKEKYLFIYSYKFSDKAEEYIKKFAKENNLKIVTSGLYTSWSDLNISCSPLEFISLIQGAEYVVTTTFHGTIFSILNKKRFVTFAQNSKVKDVLKRTHLTDRIVCENDSFESFEEKLLSEVNYDKTCEDILEMRKISLDYLRNI